MTRSHGIVLTAGFLGFYAACGAPQPPTPAASPTTSAAPGLPASSAAAPSAPPEPPTKELLGTWENQGAKLTLNSKGRARMHFGDPPCLGSYSIEANKMMIKYDPDTKGCLWKSPERIQLRGAELDIGPVTYKRVDAKDDTSF